MKLDKKISKKLLQFSFLKGDSKVIKILIILMRDYFFSEAELYSGEVSKNNKLHKHNKHNKHVCLLNKYYVYIKNKQNKLINKL